MWAVMCDNIDSRPVTATTKPTLWKVTQSHLEESVTDITLTYMLYIYTKNCLNERVPGKTISDAHTLKVYEH